MTTPSGAQIAAAAEQYVGYPYAYGGESPAGFDCSGLVDYVLTGLGVQGVPRTSEQQYAWATPESASQLQPGDLVFAQFPGDNASPGHVGIYTGSGEVLSAQDPAAGVGYDTLTDWGSAIVGYGRVPGSQPGTAATLDSVEWWNPISWLQIPGDVTSGVSNTAKDVEEFAAVGVAVLLGIGLIVLGFARATRAPQRAENIAATAAPIAAAAAA